MLGVTFSLAASGCASCSNYFFRSASGSNANFYLFVYFVLSLFVSFAIHPEIVKTAPNLTMILFGIIVGLLNIALMLVTEKALQLGSASLTFAFQNASAIFPGVLLFLIFGTAFNFSVNSFQIIGLFIVLFGLYWGCRSEVNKKVSVRWLIFALSCFIIQVAALTLIQARCLLFECGTLPVTPQDDVWFMPAQFATASLIQGLICLLNNSRIAKREAFYGFFGGIANGAATCCLLFATKSALPMEKTILFPCFSVSTIILCNLWAMKFYGEKFSFATNFICAAGILISTI